MNFQSLAGLALSYWNCGCSSPTGTRRVLGVMYHWKFPFVVSYRDACLELQLFNSK